MQSENEIRGILGDSTSPTHDSVKLLAFEFWQERGAPFGTPEIDWFRAERALQAGVEERGSALASAAKKIGSVLGSAAALFSE